MEEVEGRWWRRGGGGRETVSRSLRRSRQRLTSSRSKSVAIFSREARLFVFFCGPMLAGLTLPQVEEPGLGEKKEKEL